MVQQHDVADVVETAALLEQAGVLQHPFRRIVALFRQEGLLVLLVQAVVPRPVLDFLLIELGDDLVDLVIKVRALLGRSGNNERCAGFVDENGIHLVDDRVTELALGPVLRGERHVVAQIIKPEFVVGAVDHVTGVGSTLFQRVLPGHHNPDAQAEKLVDLAHPFGIAAGEIVVDGDDMDRPGEAVEVHGQRRHQGLAFPGFHLRDLAVVQHHAADHLYIEMAHAQGTHRRFPDDGECFRKQLLQGFALLVPFLELPALGAQRLVGQGLHAGLEGVDPIHGFRHLLHEALVAAAEYLGQQ